jgi:transposase
VTDAEADRASLLQQVLDKQLTQTAAAEILHITDRQIRRLLKSYIADGVSGLAHKSRGRPSSNKLPAGSNDLAIELVRAKYPDFGPTLAAEKLAERDGLKIGVESLRKLMIQSGIWKPKKRKTSHRSRRERRSCYGDMEQFDGCRHNWFEGRLEDGKWATLLASRDDASNTVEARFLEYEGTVPVMLFWREYISVHGKPRSIYLDRHSTYKVNSKNALDDDSMLSQFERAMKELDIEIIHANSPQAKGRIENLFGTLQDRLVKEMRLEGISDVDTANQFLEHKFLPEFNKRFSVEPANSANVHRPKGDTKSLVTALSIKHQRYINKDFTIQFHGMWIQLKKVQPTLVVPGKRIVIEERLDGSIHINLNDHYLKYQILKQKPMLVAQKQPIALTSNPAKPRPVNTPSANHPWRKFKLLPYNITSKPNQRKPSKKMS